MNLKSRERERASAIGLICPRICLNETVNCSWTLSVKKQICLPDQQGPQVTQAANIANNSVKSIENLSK